MSKIDDVLLKVRDLTKKYNPDQPRDPGGEGGGQWVSGGGSNDPKAKEGFKPKGPQPADAPLNSRGEPVYDNSAFKYDDNPEDAAATESIKSNGAATLKLFQHKVKQKVKSGPKDAEYWQGMLGEAKGWHKNLVSDRNRKTAESSYKALLSCTEGIDDPDE